MRIWTQHFRSMRIRIQHFRLMRIRMRIRIRIQVEGSDDQKLIKVYNWKKNLILFFIKSCNLLIPRFSLRTSKQQEKASALKREHPTHQNLKFLPFFSFLWFIFALLDPDPGPVTTKINADPCGSGSETLLVVNCLCYQCKTMKVLNEEVIRYR